ncbi:MAG TPA: chemotaxis protein CheX [Ruminiclostridium sp.]
MDLKEQLIQSSTNILPQFGLRTEFQGAIEENQLSSANQVNILIGFSGGLTGNMVVGFKKTTAFKVISTMMGGVDVTALDVIGSSAIGEITTMIAGNAMAGMEAKTPIIFSPPTIVTGERIFLIISRLKANKLTFRLGDDLFNISFCLE